MSWANTNKKTSLVMCLIRFTPKTLEKWSNRAIHNSFQHFFTQQNLQTSKDRKVSVLSFFYYSFHFNLFLSVKLREWQCTDTDASVTSFHYFSFYLPSTKPEGKLKHKKCHCHFLPFLHISFLLPFLQQNSKEWVQWQKWPVPQWLWKPMTNT